MKIVKLNYLMLASVSTVFFSTPLWAHPGHMSNETFDGVLHVFSGIDHLLASLLFGLLLSLQTIRISFLALLGSFSCLLVGFVAGSILGEFSLMEVMLFSSVLLLFVCIFNRESFTNTKNIFICSLVFLLHGYAHGVETDFSQQVFFVSGLLLATVSIMLVALIVGKAFFLMRMQYAYNK